MATAVSDAYCATISVVLLLRTSVTDKLQQRLPRVRSTSAARCEPEVATCILDCRTLLVYAPSNGQLCAPYTSSILEFTNPLSAH